MAEFVQQSLEEMASEFHEMLKLGLFSPPELRGIVKKRKALEYKLRRRTKEKRDFLQYIQYEMNVLALVKCRRKEINCVINQKQVEVPVIKRIHKLYEIYFTIGCRKGRVSWESMRVDEYVLACSRFKDDISLWLSHIEFCKAQHAKKRTSRIFTNILKLHPRNADIWVLAAKHEMEQRDSMANARSLLQQALRANPTTSKLWIEYFRMELLNAELLHQKLASVISDEIQADESDVPILKGEVARIVYKNACREFSDDVELRLSMLSVCQLFDFTKSVQEFIYSDLQVNFSHSELASSAVARQPLTAFSSDKSNDDEVESAEGECFERFELAVSKLCTEKMWNFYLECCLSLLNRKTSKRHSSKLIFHTLDVFSRAADNNMLTEKSAVSWLELLVKSGQLDTALEVSSYVIKQISASSSTLWLQRLCLLIQSAADSDQIVHQISRALDSCKKNEALDVANGSLSLWRTAVEWYIINRSQDLTGLLEQGLGCQSTDVCLYIKEVYLNCVAASGEIRAVRQLYRRLSSCRPMSVSFLQKYIAVELAEAKPKMKRLRRAYDEALVQFGPKEISVWIDYIKMELTHPKGCPTKVGHLHWRAIKDLDSALVDEFSQQYAAVTDGLQMLTGDSQP